MAIGKQLSDGNPDGTALGQSSSDLISFYGATPVARYATSTGAPASTAAISSTGTAWGTATSTQMDAMIKFCHHAAIALSNYGLTTSA
jgi:hypothetical protein